MELTKGQYIIVRGNNTGVFAGELVSKEGTEVTLSNARRLWYWEGAAFLSELSVKGVSAPNSCKFPIAVPDVLILDAIEILPVSVEARKSIASVPVWSAS